LHEDCAAIQGSLVVKGVPQQSKAGLCVAGNACYRHVAHHTRAPDSKAAPHTGTSTLQSPHAA